MGADVHAYVEYASFTASDGKPFWSNFTRSMGSRNYYLFCLLAGVRGDEGPVFPPRGMPEGRVGFWTSDDYWLYVAPDDQPQLAGRDEWVTREAAEKYVSTYGSQPDLDKDGKLYRVSHPDWHSHSWLTADELEQVLSRYAAGVQGIWPAEKAVAPPEWKAALAAMRSFEADGQEARVVFWFDN